MLGKLKESGAADQVLPFGCRKEVFRTLRGTALDLCRESL